MIEKEGVIKYGRNFTRAKLEEDIRELNAWRNVLYGQGLIGQDSSRYGGDGYGNVSHKLSNMGLPSGKRKFLITGTQTGRLDKLTKEHYTVVIECYPKIDHIDVVGPMEASSEAMTHGALYNINDSISAVFHAHSPLIWTLAEELEIPITDKNVEYGTSEMAGEVERLFKYNNMMSKGIFSMGGHVDGIFSFGKSLREAGVRLMDYYISAMIRDSKK